MVHLEIAFVCFSEIIFLKKYVNRLIKKVEAYFQISEKILQL